MFGTAQAAFAWMFPALVLALGHQAEEVQDIKSSLNCHTDYMSRIDCQWTENNGTKYYIPMDLHYQKICRLKDNRHHICNRTEQPKITANSMSHCTIKDTVFAVAIQYLFIFKPRKSISIRKSFTLLGNIKLQAPFGLNVTVPEAGNYVLSWEMGCAGNSSNKLLGTLQYEVNYKQTWEPWENSVSETITGDSRQLKINSSSLGAAGTYVARVRAKPQHCEHRCLWSAWSSETQWEVKRNELDTQTAEAKVMPQNLQCAYDGIQIACTWEVTRESGKYFAFNLHYKKGKDEMIQECKPSELLRTYPHLTVHGCNIPVHDQEGLEDYEVLLELINPSVIFNPSQNIKPNAPYNLTYKNLADGRFQLEWDVFNTLYSLEYEINYKKADESWEDTKVKMIPQSTETFILPKNLLKPSSTYTIRVRAKVICEPNDPKCYRGPWSDWSLPVHLDTAPDVKISIIATCVLIMLFIIFMPVTVTAIKRKKRLWLQSIPDPAKSRLFHPDRQKSPFPLGEVTLEEDNICKLISTESGDALPQVIPRKNAEHQKDKQRESSPSAINDTKEEKVYQTLSLGTEASSLSGPERPALLTSPSEPANYNGPYLFNFQDSSLILSTFSELKAAPCQNVSHFQWEPDTPGYVKFPHIPCERLMDQCKPQPTPSWTPVLNGPEIPGVPEYYLHTDSHAKGSLGQAPFRHLADSAFSCVMSTPPTPAALLPSGYVHAKVMDGSGLSNTNPVSGPGAAVRPSTLSSRGMDPSLVFEDRVGNIQGANAHPITCSGYVLSPPSGEEARVAIAPAYSNSVEPHSLSANPQQGMRLQPFTLTIDTDLALSEHPVDRQMPTVMKPDPPPTSTVNDEAPDVILYQQGAKPILFQQLGDYCFLPGSNPTKKSESTKCNPSSPSINSEPATHPTDFQGKAFPHHPSLSREPVSSNVG
ncbi:interleukin-3 receptor class 2 subunit beta-like isoform X1 [Narcine bancroftii]|uniref:interleukin-3 receptor class 2 subunit beta-like isoform X1 n=1 Tax=Narcine bancroftii TaxID=1343680 RepID=UPI0038312DA8